MVEDVRKRRKEKVKVRGCKGDRGEEKGVSGRRKRKRRI